MVEIKSGYSLSIAESFNYRNFNSNYRIIEVNNCCRFKFLFYIYLLPYQMQFLLRNFIKNSAMKYFIIVLCCFYANSSKGQVNFHSTFQGFGAEKGYSVAVINEGFMLAGSSNTSGAGQNDVLVIKTDSDGTTVWQKNYGGSGDDVGNRIRQVSDGNFIIAGNTKSFPSGDMNFYIIKIDSSGTLLWSKVFGGPLQDSVTSFIETADLGLLIFGSTLSIGSGNNDIYMLKLDQSGNYLWSKAAGNAGNDIATSATEIYGSGFLFTGYTSSFGLNGFAPLLLRTDTIGDVQWVKTFEFATYWTGFNRFNDIVPGYLSDYVVAGQVCCGSSIGDGRTVAMSIDVLGTINWVKEFTFNSGASTARSVIKSADGQFLFGGTYSSGWAHIIKLNVLGNLQWSNYYSNASNGFEIKLTPSGQFALTGNSMTTGDYKLFLLKPEFDGTINCISTPTFSSNPFTPTPIITLRSFSTTTTNYVLTDSCNVTTSSISTTSLCLYTGIENVGNNEKEISITPNPSNELVTIIDKNPQEPILLEIFNSQGQTVYKAQDWQNKLQINISKFPSGPYFIKVIRKENMSIHKLWKI